MIARGRRPQRLRPKPIQRGLLATATIAFSIPVIWYLSISIHIRFIKCILLKARMVLPAVYLRLNCIQILFGLGFFPAGKL